NDPLKNILIQVREAKRYTFTYGLGLEFQTGQPAGASAPQGKTGVSPRVEFDVTRLNFAGRDQTITFQSHVGRLQQRGLISYTVPKLLNSNKFKLIYTIFYDNSLDVATFTSQRLEGKIDLRQQFGKAGPEPGRCTRHLPRMPPSRPTARVSPSAGTYSLARRPLDWSSRARGRVYCPPGLAL